MTGGMRNKKAVEQNLGNILVHDDLNIHGSEYIHDLQDNRLTARLALRSFLLQHRYMA